MIFIGSLKTKRNERDKMKKHVRYKQFLHICIYFIIALLLLIITFIQVNSMKTERILDSMVVSIFKSISADEKAIETRLSDLNYQTVTLAELELLSVQMADIHDDLIMLRRYSEQTGCSKEDERKQANIVALYHDIYSYVTYFLPKAKEGTLGSEVVVISSRDMSKLKFIADIHKIMGSTHDEYGSSSHFTSVENYFNDFYKRIDKHLEQHYKFKLSMSFSASSSILEMLFE